MSDRDHWELRGPVRTADIHRTWRYRKCGSGESDACEIIENGDLSIVEFRPDGAMSRHWHRNPDGSEITVTYSYDPEGRLATVKFESPSGPKHLGLYEYDSLGRLTRHLSRDPEGGERTVESYSYDPEGLKTKTLVDLAAQRPNTTYYWGVEGSKAQYSAPNTATIITNYDHAGRPTKLLFHDAADALVSRVELHYDAFGQLIEEAQTQIAPSLTTHLQEQLNAEQMAVIQSVLAGPLTRLLHRYDSLGNRIETLRSLFGSLGNERMVMAYNQYGDLVAQTSEEESHNYGLDDQGQLAEGPVRRNHSESRFRYEYDTHGNWTTKITEVRHDDNSDFSVTGTEQRTLIYFDPI